MCIMENISEIEESGIYNYIYITYKKDRYDEYKRCIMIPKVLDAHIEYLKNDVFMLSSQSTTIDVAIEETI